MKSRNTISLFVTIVLLALLLVACDSSAPVYPTSSAPAPAEEAPVADEPALAAEESAPVAEEPVVEEDVALGEKLVVGTSADYYPFEYYTPDFQIDGFDIALIREIGQRLGMEVEIRDFAFDGLGGALELEQIDVAIGAISVTPERAAQVDFSDIYFVGEDGVLASDASDIVEIGSIEELAAYSVGVQSGSVYEDLIENALVETGILPENQFFVYQTADEAVRNLIEDQVELVVLDYQPAKAVADSGAGKLILKNRRGRVLLTYGPGQAVPLEGTEWALATYMDADGAMAGAIPAAESTAVFANGNLAGKAGCNGFNASYEVDGENLAISPDGAMTQMFCEQPEGVMDQEAAVMSAFGAVSQYRIRQRTLELLDADGTAQLVYFANPSIEEISSVTWVLESFGPMNAQQPALEDVEVTLQVDEKGQISGSAGCNSYNTTLETTEDGISIGPAAVTMMMCPEEEVNAQEGAYLAALQSATGAAVRGDRLIVTYGDDQEVLTFAPQKTDPLSGTAWLLETYSQDEVPVLPDANISLIFGYNGDVHGFAGCNNFFGDYKADEEKLRFGKFGSTMMLCPTDEQNDLEQDYLSGLKATRSYETEGVRLVGRGLHRQKYAMAVRQGDTDLREALNRALASMVAEGRIIELAEQYLDIADPTPPIPTPPSCIDGMAWVADLNYDDDDMTNPPELNPGEAFSKGWRIKNTGTCDWDSATMLVPDGGNVPDARMGGQPTPIEGVIKPGETYDMYVDLVAPTNPGAYQGFWKMHNGDGVGFGQRIYVGIRVPLAPTPTPAPTQTPSPDIQFSADRTQLKQGECTTIWWDVQNVKAVYFYEDGQDWRQHGVNGTGNRTVCPPVTTTYNLRVEKLDGNVETRSITIYVEPSPDAPDIVLFSVQPQKIEIGECVTIKWDVRGDVTRVRLSANNDVLWDRAPVRGNTNNCPPGPQTVTYILEAWGPGGTSRSVQYIDVVKPGPDTPTPTAVPPTATPEPTPEGPVIYSFSATPSQIELGQCVLLEWKFGGSSLALARIFRGDEEILRDPPNSGSQQDCPPAAGKVEYKLVVDSEFGGTARQSAFVEVVGPAPRPTNTPAPLPTDTPEPLPTDTPEPLPTDTPEPLPTDTPELPTPEPTTEPPPGQDLLGTWLLQSTYTGRAAPQPILAGTEINVVFGPDGSVSGFAGCNHYNGTYSVSANNFLTISALSVTQQLCSEPEGVAEQEQAYLDVLQAASGYQVTGGQLQIFSNGGKDGLNYQAQ